MAATESGGHSHPIVQPPIDWAWQKFLSLTGLDARWGDIHVPDHVAMCLFVLGVIVAIFVPMRFALSKENPGKFQQLLELLVKGIQNMIDETVGHGAHRRYTAFIGALTVFILFANLSGMFYFLKAPTSNVNTTFALSITAFFYYHYAGIKRQGLAYFKFILGPVAWLFILFVPLEIISHMVRAVSLSLRLFGNIFGGGAAAGAFFSIAPIVLPLPIMVLELFAGLLQTFIFVLLTVVYIAGAEATEH